MFFQFEPLKQGVASHFQNLTSHKIISVYKQTQDSNLQISLLFWGGGGFCGWFEMNSN